MKQGSSQHWLEEIAHNLLQKNLKQITLATGKTPSGHIHIGILREIIICDSIRRILEKNDNNVRSNLFFDSLDAAKRFPGYIPENFRIEHKGKPFFLIPCPFEDCGCESYANHFGNELTSTFNDFGIKVNTIWSHELYKTKEMQDKIKIALDHTDEIKKIIKKYILPTLDDDKKKKFLEMQKNWMPLMAICEKCDKIQYVNKDGTIEPNRVKKYLKKEEIIEYTCAACNHSGKLSLYSGRLKLNWRVDWPVKWALFKTNCEPAGKDHAVKGGAYDTGIEICKRIFGYEGPMRIPYEWLRLGDKDMKTSKGIVFTPSKYLTLADPEIFRMLILRTNPIKHISLRVEEMPQYYDFYEKMENKYYKIEAEDINEDKNALEYIYPLVKVDEIKTKKQKTIPFKVLSFLSQLQNILSLDKLYTKFLSILDYGSKDDIPSIEKFEKLLIRTKSWIDEVKKIIENEKDAKIKKTIQQKILIFEIKEKLDKKIVEHLNEKQIQGLKLLNEFFKENDKLDEDTIQNKIFTIAKNDLGIPPKHLFQAIYSIILGKKKGPRLGSFLLLLDKAWLVERLSVE
ncbi:MAG: lysine--tRNA ligase [Promethearchaeota archaeon]